MDYKICMQGVDASGNGLPGTLKDLEKDFKGLKYHSLRGAERIGRPKIYTESFAEEERMKVYFPPNITHSSTTLELKLFFFGKDRYNVFDQFTSYIGNGIHRYWDSARKKQFDFIVKDEISAEKETWKDGEPYIEVTFKLTNIDGVSKFSNGLI